MSEQKLRRTMVPVYLLLAVNVLMLVTLLVFWLGGSSQRDRLSKYTLYIGTNDKDTYTQLIPTDEARQIVNAICEAHTGGYTVLDANGGWVDETGTETTEHTLVYTFYDVTEAQIRAIADEVLLALHQNSILVEHALVDAQYYSG